MNKKFSFVLFGFLALWAIAGIINFSSFTHADVQASFWESLFGKKSSTTAQVNEEEKKIDSYKPAIDYEAAVVRAVETSSPAVVSIVITKDLPIIENCAFNPFSNLPPEFQQFFGGYQFNQPCEKGKKKQEVGGGSGFIVSGDGLVVTNKHVVADTDAQYTILLNDGKKYDAKVLARDPVQDIAVVKIVSAPANLPVVTIGNSDSIKLGQTAIAIGNALGEFRNTVSVGIISGLSRHITAQGNGSSETLDGLIQTDAAINPGNSGGPLLNLRGEVIGVNTAIAEGAQNIGFTIPINKVKRDIESVKKSGKIVVPYLGVRYILLNENIAKRDKLSITEGALVRGGEDGPAVMSGSPAEKAGIVAEDIIVEIDGKKINKDNTLGALIQNYSVGDAAKVSIIRQGKTLKLTVIFSERPEEE